MKINKSLKTRVANFRSARLHKDELEESIRQTQPELIVAMQEAGLNNEVGVVYDPDDENKGAAYVQQNKPTEFWDDEGIIAWLNKPANGRKTLLNACTTRVLDLQKWEAEVGAGNVPPKVANRLKKTGEVPKPFIRFGKITKKCVQ